jgi:hypothetical protein
MGASIEVSFGGMQPSSLAFNGSLLAILIILLLDWFGEEGE